MASDNDVVRRNYLRVMVMKSKDGLLGSLTRMGSKKNWVVLRGPSFNGKSRVEVYKDEDTATRQSGAWRVIALEQVTKVQMSSERKEFILVTKDDSISFICSSRADLDDWLRDLENVRRGDKAGRSKDPMVASNPQYPDDETYRVRLRQSSSLLFHGDCLLEIQRDFDRNLFHISIYTVTDEPPKLIVKWQIDHIRQYGSNDVAFKFQSGTKSPTGVDWFILDTDAGAATKIHRSVDYWAKHIVDQVKNTPAVPAPRHMSTGGRKPTTPPLPSPPLPPILSSSVPASSSANGTYAPLIPDTRQPAAIYEDLNKPKPSNIPPPLPPHPQESHYQAINQTTREDSSTSMYAGLQDATRERQRSVSTYPNPARSSIDAEYMRLNPMTQQNPETSTYMDIARK